MAASRTPSSGFPEMPQSSETDPIMVEVTRGGIAESVHRVDAVIAAADGTLVEVFGAGALGVFPRSAIKSIQTLPLVETGAADAFRLDDRHLAIASGSHRGEPAHVDLVGGWLGDVGLGDVGLGERDLECGSHRPLGEAATDALIAAGTESTQLHNNCSGKHAGMLTTARHLGEATRGYVGADHPVQKRVATALSVVADEDLTSAPGGIDGCGIPTIAVPLAGRARAMARLARPTPLGPTRAAAVTRIKGAWAAHPFLMSGTGSSDHAFITATGGRVLTKTGAEGVYCAVIEDAGIGVALKVADGAFRASHVTLAALLRRLGALSESQAATLTGFADPIVATRRGIEAGRMRAVFP